MIGLITVEIIGGGRYGYFGSYGIPNLEGIAYSLWHQPKNLGCEPNQLDVLVQGIFVQSLPYLNNLFVSVMLMSLWFCLNLLIIGFTLRRYEVN